MARQYLGRDVKITFRDGAGTPITLAANAHLSDASIQSLTSQQREWLISQARGANHSRRKGNRVDITFSATFTLDKDYADVATASVFNWVKVLGLYASGGGSALTSKDTDADGIVFDILVEFMAEDDTTVTDQVIFDLVVAKEGAISLNGEFYTLPVTFTVTGTDTWS